jgi:antitoxin (DNA-binding transcriptional repressor) of toxin-antitoxin stability system
VSTVTIEEAQAKLPELIEQLGIGEEIIITREARPMAKLVPPVVQGKPLFGRGRGTIVVLAEDHEHLKDFEDYMP